MRFLLTIAALLLSTSLSFAENYIVSVPKSDGAMKTMAAGASPICFDNTCYYTVSKEEALRLHSAGKIQGYEPEMIFKKFGTANDSMYSAQWYLSNYEMGWESGKNIIATVPVPADPPIIAIFDTGFTSHEDVSTSRLHNNTSYGIVCANNNDYTTCIISDINRQDRDGHGTAVLGVAGADTDNHKGMASASYGKIKLLPVNVFSGDQAPETYVLAAAKFVIDEKRAGANIVAINMSLGTDCLPLGTQPSAAYTSAVQDLLNEDIIIIAAAGNDGKDLGKCTVFPADINKANVISVAALNQNLGKPSYTNYGGYTSIAAPGGGDLNNNMTWEQAEKIGILSLDEEEPGYDPYGIGAGTSLAAPYVSGAIGAASYIAPSASGAQLVNMLYASAAQPENLLGISYDSRRLDMAAYMSAALACRSNCAGVSTSYPTRDKTSDEYTPEKSGGGGGGGCAINGKSGGIMDALILLFIPAAVLMRRKLVK